MKKIIGVVLVGVCVLLVGCGQSAQENTITSTIKAVATIAGGPADGHTRDWYETHPSEADAEAVYCWKKYEIKGMNFPSNFPDYCLFAAGIP